jgi:RND family efflux transporter MFP subunit
MCVRRALTKDMNFKSLFFIVLAFAVAGCGNKEQGAAPAAGGAMPAMPVGMVTANPTPVAQSTEYVGTLKSRNSSTIIPQVEGIVTKILVRSGEQVKAGARLMQIDPLKQQAMVGSQEANRAAQVANVKYAEQQLNRTKNLANAGVVSKQELDQSQAAYDAAKGSLEALDASVREQTVQLKYYSVTAPTGGIVGDIPVHEGDHVTTATVLTTVDQPGPLELYINVPVERSGDLSLGKKVEILDAQGKATADGKITFVSPHVDDQTQTILVKALIENKGDKLRTSQFTRTRIIWGSTPGVTIPVLAVSRINGQFFAYVAQGPDAKDLKAHQVQIQVGDMIGNDYVVQSGIKAGDRIITSNTQMLFEGAAVTPKS